MRLTTFASTFLSHSFTFGSRVSVLRDFDFVQVDYTRGRPNLNEYSSLVARTNLEPAPTGSNRTSSPHPISSLGVLTYPPSTSLLISSHPKGPSSAHLPQRRIQVIIDQSRFRPLFLDRSIRNRSYRNKWYRTVGRRAWRERVSEEIRQEE